MSKIINKQKIITFLLVFVLTTFAFLEVSSAETLNPDKLFYITGSVSKTEISEADKDSSGKYPLSYAAKACLPDVLCGYIVQFADFVSDFSFRVDVQLTQGLIPDEGSVSFDCAFGSLGNVSVSGRMMYIDVVLKPGTSLSDYTYEQWVAPMNLSFNASLEGEAFSPGNEVCVSLGVSGLVAGSHPLVGEQSILIHGVMDPTCEIITTKMIAGETKHTEQTPVPPEPSSSVEDPTTGSSSGNSSGDSTNGKTPLESLLSKLGLTSDDLEAVTTPGATDGGQGTDGENGSLQEDGNINQDGGILSSGGGLSGFIARMLINSKNPILTITIALASIIILVIIIIVVIIRIKRRRRDKRTWK